MTVEIPELEKLTVGKSTGELDKQHLQDHDGDTSCAKSILTLPDELLNNILEHAITLRPTNSWGGGTLRSGYDPSLIMTVALTCRRFSQIIVPFYYRQTLSDYNMRLVPPDSRFKLLVRTLQANPVLGLHCRRLNSNIPDNGNMEGAGQGCGLAEQFPAFLPSIKKLYIRGGFGKDGNKPAWTFLRACVRHMRQLEDVNLQRIAIEGLEVADFLEVFQASSLKRLRVGGFARSNCQFETLKIQKISSLKIMEIEDYSDGAETLRILLSWPEALSSFRLLGSYYGNGLYIDLPMLKSMLLPHKESLVSLDIAHLPRESQAKLCNFSEFSALEKLSLSRWQLGDSKQKLPDSPEIFKNCLSPPRLRKFTWTFAVVSQAWLQWDDFGHEEESWLRKLAQEAIARKSLLRKIRIFFNPLSPGPLEQYREYPWDRMDVLNKEFQPQGIVVTYITPTTKRDNWEWACNMDAMRRYERIRSME